MVHSSKVTNTKPEKVRFNKKFDFEQIIPKNNRSDQKYNFVQGSKNHPNAFRCGDNSFVMSAVKAYSDHHHLTIRPDDVWLAICTQFSNYINGNSEQLRDKFVDFKGKKQLVVSGGGTLLTANYEDLCNRMTFEISKNIKDKDIREWVIPNFTTTNDTDKMVGAVVLMASMKSYFDYKMCLMCNLPSVTLLGEVDDWLQVRNRASKLLEFDLSKKEMSKWTNLLFPVLDNFVNTAKGNPDITWWNKIVHYEGGGSGPTYISGWITTFCVFDEKGIYMGDHKAINNWGDIIKSEWPIIDTNDIPRGYVNVPIVIDDNGTEYNTEMFAGHMYSYNDNECSITPAVGWALFTV